MFEENHSKNPDVGTQTSCESPQRRVYDVEPAPRAAPHNKLFYTGYSPRPTSPTWPGCRVTACHSDHHNKHSVSATHCAGVRPRSVSLWLASWLKRARVQPRSRSLACFHTDASVPRRKKHSLKLPQQNIVQLFTHSGKQDSQSWEKQADFQRSSQTAGRRFNFQDSRNFQPTCLNMNQWKKVWCHVGSLQTWHMNTKIPAMPPPMVHVNTFRCSPYTPEPNKPRPIGPPSETVVD